MRVVFSILALFTFGWNLSCAEEPAEVSLDAIIDDIVLVPEPRHEKIAQLVSDFVEKTHYVTMVVDDALSAKALDRYIHGLDNGRMYLLASDLENFEVYRDRFDDAVKSETLSPVFEIYEVYRSRFRERLAFALSQLATEPDFSIQESYEFDRSDQPWMQTQVQADDHWRRRVKYDALNLMLAEKTWTESQAILSKRYARMLQGMDRITSDDVFEAFMYAFTHAVDPHSNYTPASNLRSNRNPLIHGYVGVGVSLQIENDLAQVVKIDTGGPAETDGRLQLLDRITAVGQGNDEPLVDVIGWDLDEIVRLVRGPPGTDVRLQVLPAGAHPGSPEKVISLTRLPFDLGVGRSGVGGKIISVMRGDRELAIGVITVPAFYLDFPASSEVDAEVTSTTSDVRRLIEELKAQGIDGLIVDLRNNGGGHLTEAVALSGLFVENGPVLQLQLGDGRLYNFDDPDPVARSFYVGPLAVLVNRNSASASEIFAAAVQDHARGVIVGQKTFGMATIQNAYSLDEYAEKSKDDSYGVLTLTIGKFYRVTGISPQLHGIDPDIDLPSSIDPELVGESVNDNALPWDAVPEKKFRAGDSLSGLIALLNANLVSRSKDDPDYQLLLDEVERIRQDRARKHISLNIDDRRAARALESQETTDDLHPQAAPDLLLRLVGQIVVDMVEPPE